MKIRFDRIQPSSSLVNMYFLNKKWKASFIHVSCMYSYETNSYEKDLTKNIKMKSIKKSIKKMGER